AEQHRPKAAPKLSENAERRARRSSELALDPYHDAIERGRAEHGHEEPTQYQQRQDGAPGREQRAEILELAVSRELRVEPRLQVTPPAEHEARLHYDQQEARHQR